LQQSFLSGAYQSDWFLTLSLLFFFCFVLQQSPDEFAQVDANGSAWVAGYTESSLDGHTNAGGRDIFLMKFDAQGVHLWTRQRGGESGDFAYALQADGVRLRFRIFPWKRNVEKL
jgi:hypothetical protein